MKGNNMTDAENGTAPKEKGPYRKGWEPVRVIAWLTSVVTVIGGVVVQVSSTTDESTGWFGAAAALLVAITAELERNRVTPVKKIETVTYVNETSS